ncbi:MAG: hypothetical protein K2J14_06340 [Treponemataceae bacterium]|nr:hypothetical protein [Treponemataceae bacterium]
MLQFYFLAVLLNVMAGLILVYAADFTRGTSLGAPADGMDDDLDAGAAESSEAADGDDGGRLFAHESFMNDSLFRLVVGILAVFSGVLLFVSPVQNDAPVVGDLVPALACICGGAALLLEFYANKLSTEIRLPFFLQAVMVTGRRYLGVFCIIAGIVHFIFPRVMFL